MGVLVLSAIPNELEASISSGQVKEDILLLRAIGIDSIIIAINKLDKLNWKRELFDSAKNTITPLIKSARYKQITFAACSGWEGKGITNNSYEDIPSLIDSITSLSNKDGIKKCENKFIETNIISADIFVLNCTVFSIGYISMIHTNKGSFSFVVDNIKDTDKRNPFMKTGDRGNVLLTLYDKIKIYNKERIIIRSADSTIGYGLIIC